MCGSRAFVCAHYSKPCLKRLQQQLGLHPASFRLSLAAEALVCLQLLGVHGSVHRAAHCALRACTVSISSSLYSQLASIAAQLLSKLPVCVPATFGQRADLDGTHVKQAAQRQCIAVCGAGIIKVCCCPVDCA
jgi:hypothetical protein